MAAGGSGVAFTSSSSSKAAEDFRLETVKEIRSHEVAIAELNHLSSSRTVYQKNGNLFFRTSIQKATASEQSEQLFLSFGAHLLRYMPLSSNHELQTPTTAEQLDLAKAKLQKLSSS